MLESQHGRGVFVAKRRAIYSASEKKRRMDHALTVFLSDVVTLDYTPEQIQAEVVKRLEHLATTRG